MGVERVPHGRMGASSDVWHDVGPLSHDKGSPTERPNTPLRHCVSWIWRECARTSCEIAKLQNCHIASV